MIKSVATKRKWKPQPTYEYGILAQLGEHLPYKQRVTGSSPVGPIDMPTWLNGRAADL